MDIIVCIKPVLDPDLPPAKFRIDSGKNRVLPPEGMPLVINPYDAQAVEAALKIKEAKKTGKVTVLMLGEPSAEGVLRKTLAMGADEGVLLFDPAFDGSDGFGTAHLLAQAIRKIGKYDLILCGRQAADWDVGMVGSALAEYLGIPVVTRAKAIGVLDGKLNVERAVTNGNESYELPLPAVITVSNEFGQARIPKGWGIISAAKKPIPKWDAGQLGADPAKIGGGAVRNPLRRLYVPSYERHCEMIGGKDPAEAAALLAKKIAEIKPS
jgi:electron transfer flavoprotein beta subunit